MSEINQRFEEIMSAADLEENITYNEVGYYEISLDDDIENIRATYKECLEFFEAAYSASESIPDDLLNEIDWQWKNKVDELNFFDLKKGDNIAIKTGAKYIIPASDIENTYYSQVEASDEIVGVYDGVEIYIVEVENEYNQSTKVKTGPGMKITRPVLEYGQDDFAEKVAPFIIVPIDHEENHPIKRYSREE